MEDRQHLLVFGASGMIGKSISNYFMEKGWKVTAVVRNQNTAGTCSQELIYDPFSRDITKGNNLDTKDPYDAVCWAQGVNANDSVYDVDLDRHHDVYQTNCLYILASLKQLLNSRLLASNARLCIISSIWQKLARQNKLSYCMSKSALQGLVMSASADLAKEGILINAVLPGALDTPMTRKNVSEEQLAGLIESTYFNKLPTLEDVSGLVYFLCSSLNSGITGQFIAADLGFGHVRLL